jgi:putative Mn2+ efflux pump MntP
MGWIEYLLIVAGSSLEIFVAMECQGSLIQKVNKKQLTAICFIVAVCQLLAMYIGYFLSSFLNGKYSVKDEALLGEIISIGILIGLGIRLIGKAIRNERIEEHCQAQLDMKRVLRIAGITAFYTVLAGIAFGFLGTGLLAIMIMVALLTVICIVAGIYTGYHFGFEQKTKVYIVGAILFWAAGIDVIVRLVSAK